MVKPVIKVLILSAFLSVPSSAESKTTGKYQTMTPIFDSSLPKPKIFQLNVKHTELFQEAVQLHGETKLIELQAKEDSTEPLRGKVSKDEQAQSSTISTLEHDVTPRFFVDLRKLEAKYAPDLAQMMQAALAAARRREAEEVAREEPIMEKKLKERKPVPDIVVPLRKNANVDSNSLQAQLDKSNDNKKLQDRNAEQVLQLALKQSQSAKGMQIPVMPEKAPVMIPSNAIGKLPDLSVPAVPRVEMPDKNVIPKVQIPEEKIPENKKTVPNVPLVAIPNNLANKGPKAIPEVKADLRIPDINAAINSAKNKAQTVAKQVVPAMDAVLTYLRELPSSKESVSTNTEVAMETSSVIEWDKWHASFAQLARAPILKCVDESGNPSGNNTVEVTVWPNRHVEVKLAKSSNPSFDKAIMKAYQSLDGNPALAYPKGSRRSNVSFLIDNKHEGAGRPSAVNSQSSVGDKEVLRQSFSPGLKVKP